MVKQKVTLPIDDRTVAILLLTTDAMAVLANDEVCALLTQLPAGLLQLWRRIAIMFLTTMVKNNNEITFAL